ncbi:O-methyltransferase family protein [Aphelenchoides avenae]|nr:O-methyltransferase family protein [Aphelenchus avenae]
MDSQPHKGTVSKSYYENGDPIIRYCTQLSVKQTDVEKELQKKTLDEAARSVMMGAPEVLQLGKNFIRLIAAKKVLDIGTFTGFSAVAWATALPADGRVLTMDISHEALNAHGKTVIDRYPEVAGKIDFRLGASLNVLEELIAKGESGTWDMAFIDADKQNNWNYFCKCKQLLRSGGVILVDNALAGGKVATESESNERLDAIRDCNQRIFEDEETDSILLNLGDGTHVAFKH